VLPFGLLLTQYTITGFDASAHLSEETASASKAAATGIWQSIFYSAIGGWILLLCFLFAVPNGADGKPDNAGVSAAVASPTSSPRHGLGWAVVILALAHRAVLLHDRLHDERSRG
jgi:amino acid transporter